MEILQELSVKVKGKRYLGDRVYIEPAMHNGARLSFIHVGDGEEEVIYLTTKSIRELKLWLEEQG